MARALLAVLAVVLLLAIATVGWAISVNNQLVRLDQDVSEKWAQVQNVYQRRADLIPNLVETVKGFAGQERTVLNEVTSARARASSIQLPPQLLVLALTLPAAPSGHINDYAGVLSPAERDRLERRAAAEEPRTGNQVVVAIFPSLGGESLEDVSIRLAERWKIGRAGRDN